MERHPLFGTFTLDDVKTFVQYNGMFNRNNVLDYCVNSFSNKKPPPPEQLEILKFVLENGGTFNPYARGIERYVTANRTLFESIPASFIPTAMDVLPKEIATRLLDYIHKWDIDGHVFDKCPSYLFLFGFGYDKYDENAIVLLNLGARVDEIPLREKFREIQQMHDRPRHVKSMAQHLLDWADEQLLHSARMLAVRPPPASHRIAAVSTPASHEEDVRKRTKTADIRTIGYVTNNPDLLKQIEKFLPANKQLINNAKIIKKVLRDMSGGTRKRRKRKSLKSGGTHKRRKRKSLKSRN